MFVIAREVCREEKRALAHEWLVTNGRGSYASTSIVGALTRRQHGLLVTMLGTPHRPTVTLAKVDEEVEVGGQVYKLGTNEYVGNFINPDGFLYLQQVTFDGILAKFVYEAGRFQLTKTIWMEPQLGTTYIRYSLAEHSAPVRLTLLPLCDHRAHDSLTHGNEQWHFQVESLANGIRVTAHEGATPYRILVEPHATFTPLDLWYWKFQLRSDDNASSDLYVPGLFRTDLMPGNTIAMIATVEPDDALQLDVGRALERARVRTDEHTVPPSDQFSPEVFLALAR